MTITNYTPSGNPDFIVNQNFYGQQILNTGDTTAPYGTTTYGPFAMQSAVGIGIEVNNYAATSLSVEFLWNGGSGSVYASFAENFLIEGVTNFTMNVPVAAPYLTITVSNESGTVTGNAFILVFTTSKNTRQAATPWTDGIAITESTTSYPVGSTYVPPTSWSPGWYSYAIRCRAALTGAFYLKGRWGGSNYVSYITYVNPANNFASFGYILIGNYTPYVLVVNSGSSAVSIDFSLIAVPQ